MCVLSSRTHVSLSAKLEAMDGMSSSRSISDSVSVSSEWSSSSVLSLIASGLALWGWGRVNGMQ